MSFRRIPPGQIQNALSTALDHTPQGSSEIADRSNNCQVGRVSTSSVVHESQPAMCTGTTTNARLQTLSALQNLENASELVSNLQSEVLDLGRKIYGILGQPSLSYLEDTSTFRKSSLARHILSVSSKHPNPEAVQEMGRSIRVIQLAEFDRRKLNEFLDNIFGASASLDFLSLAFEQERGSVLQYLRYFQTWDSVILRRFASKNVAEVESVGVVTTKLWTGEASLGEQGTGRQELLKSIEDTIQRGKKLIDLGNFDNGVLEPGDL
ncbi:hypothetical protein DFH27DRAFT_526282 [Peziza echinospora]|nr:hypothetical protein DFH27DRAFT_526282 [Peziza echinospora]